MKLAYVLDVAGVESFYVENGTAYSFKDDKPYSFFHSVDPTLFMGGWNYPFLWDGGCYLHLNEWFEKGLELPDFDFDIILYGNERKGLDPGSYNDFKVDVLRDKYPNAKIVGWFKEIEIPFREGRQEQRLRNRIRFFKDCDVVASHAVPGDSIMKQLPQIEYIERQLGKKIDYYISHPININGYYDNFYSEEKELSIYAYLPNSTRRTGETYMFASYLSNKYNLPLKHKPLKPGQKFAYLSQKDFINLWSPSLFHINMDPLYTQPGMQGIQVAAVGSINLGGLNESHFYLYPETANNDPKLLEEKFVQYLKDETYRFRVLNHAWETLNEIYNYKLVEKQLEDVYNDKRC